MTTAFQHSDAALDSGGAAGVVQAPFSPAIDEDFFYPETQRAKCLHFLLHLVPYSHVLLLTGAVGSGKTCLLHQLQFKSNPAWRICCIDADEVGDIDAILKVLAEVFLFEIAPDLDLDAKLQSLGKMLRAMRNSSLVPVLIFDNADRLETALLRFLDRLVVPEQAQESLLCIVLAGTPDLEGRLQEPALQPLRLHVGHSFELHPFDREQTEGYIKHRLAVAGIADASLFSLTDFAEIYRESGGLPGQINVYAQRRWAHCEDAPHAAVALLAGKEDGKPFPWRAIGIILLCLLVVVALFFQDRINAWFALTPPAVPHHKSTALDPRPSPEGLAADVIVRQRETTLPAVSAGPTLSAPKESVDQPHDATAAPAAGIQTEALALSNKASKTSGSADATRKDFIILEEPQAVDQHAAETAKDLVASAAARGEHQSSPSTTGPEDSDKAWILARNPRHYTIQLIAMDRPKVMALTQKWQLQPPPVYFSTRGNLTAVLYGDYASQQAAAKAGAALRQRLSGIRPWIRSFASIQQVLNVHKLAPDKVMVERQAHATAAGSPDAMLVEREEWLLQRERRHFTLQLMAMDLSAVTKRVNRWSIASQVAYYRTLKGDRELVAVTYGDYPTRQAADAASRRLTRRIKGIKPWIRSFSAIQSAIHGFRSISR